MHTIIGIDIGGTKCAVVLGEVAQGIRIVDRIGFPTLAHKGYPQARERIFQAVDEMMERHALIPKDVRAIGVSCGGPLNSKQGVVLCPPNLPGWVDVPIVALLEERFRVPAFLQNDAKACALVEWKMGAGRGCRDMVFLTMGTGMGGGIIAGDRLISGASDMGGEVGHIRIEEDGPVGFGKHGSFEGFTSGGGIARLAQSLAREAKLNGKPFSFAAGEEAIRVLDTKTLAQAAQAGDGDAVRIFHIVGEKLGKGLALLIDILNPERIVIGSIFVRCEALLRPAMETVLKRECIHFSLEACRVVPARTGEDLGDLAAVMVAAHALALV